MTILLQRFMQDLMTDHGCDTIKIVKDNARMTPKQIETIPPLTNCSNHSLSRSSTHSQTRWIGDETPPTPMADLMDATVSVSSVPIAPMRKLSREPACLSSSKRKPRRGMTNNDMRDKMNMLKSRKPKTPPAWSQKQAPLSPTRASLQNRQNNPVYVARNLSPKRTKARRRTNVEKSINNTILDFKNKTRVLPRPTPLSPLMSPESSVPMLSDHFRLHGRSLSKTLTSCQAEVNPQAPQLPTRKPSAQPDMNSPPPPRSNVKVKAYAVQKRKKKKKKKKKKRSKKKKEDNATVSPSSQGSRISISSPLSAPPPIPFLVSPAKSSYKKQRFKLLRRLVKLNNSSPFK